MAFIVKKIRETIIPQSEVIDMVELEAGRKILLISTHIEGIVL